MEEDGSVKAPMTRLRRRLSVETSEDTKSPAGTPTKKRGAKLAAKPQLDLIEENAIQNSPKRATRKSLAKELVDTPVEKPVTPARRSSRVKSNTSSVSEPTQSSDTPRAKRLARRNSQLDSDTETSNTPARTRRTRKDSTSSLDKLAVETPVTPGRARRTKNTSTSVADEEVESKNLIKEVITEEPEIQDDKKDKTTEKTASPNSPRKSPRLAKKKRRSYSNQPDSESNDKLDNKDDTNEKNNETMVEKDDDVEPNKDKKDLSLASINLIKDLDDKPSKSNALNKSSSAAEVFKNSRSNRQRTKSWTTLTVPAPEHPNFFSDNESTKKKKRNEKSLSKGSGDSILNVSHSNISLSKSYEKYVVEAIDSSAKKKKNRNEMTLNDSSFTPTDSHTTKYSKPLNTSSESNKENKGKETSKNDTNLTIDLLFKMKPTNVQSMVLVDDSDTDSMKLVETGDQCVPVVDHQLNKDEELESKTSSKSDVHNNIFTVFQTEAANNSVEPMDIDETLTNSLIINDSKDGNESVSSNLKANESVNKSRRKTSICNQSQKEEQTSQETYEKVNKSGRKSSLTKPIEVTTAIMNESKQNSTLPMQKDTEPTLNNSKSTNDPEEPNETVNKSKRKSKNSISMSQDLDKSGNDNKSTLVLSQIKDTSMGNHDTKSIQDKVTDNSVVLNNSVSKKSANNLKISSDYMTSTPVQDKNVKKLALQMNTSIITPTDTKKSKKTTKSPVKEESIHSEDTDSSDVSKSKNSLVNDEAEDAGEDYESGDSQDEEERQYEEENQIVEKGETLDSEQDFSDESDYEKDSFVVSSDEEDEELLSGSGDDLGMSDNELTMSAKSKKKFDEKAKKLQKKASKEMFEARHKLDKSANSSKEQSNNKKNRLRLDSTQSGDEMQVPKKTKRMRLDTYDSSNADQSITKSTDDPEKLSNSTSQKVNNTVNESVAEEIGHKKKKSKRLSESVCESEPGDDVTDSVNTAKNKKKNKRLSESICNQSVLKEHEITVTTINENEKNNEDPLQVNVKMEPKTPQKDFDISTVNITCREDVEQVNIDENASMLKSNDTVDPLLSMIAEDEDDDSDVSSISENEEITKNYNSVLNELNKESSKKIKTNDISLNNNKKGKKKNDTIIDQLNITQPKDKKTPKKHNVDDKKKQKNEVSSVNEDFSDSIDLKLLFSDDSNDSAPTPKEIDADESFIPLKRTEGKTNIRGSITTTETTKDNSLLNTSTKSKNKNRKSSTSENATTADPSLNEVETSLNTSSKKKKKNRKSSQSEVATESNLMEGEPLNFFMDTEGAYSETNNEKLNTSSKMTQKLDTAISIDKKNIANDNDSDDDAPIEVSFRFEKNDQQTKNSESSNINGQNQNSSLVKTPKSGKKKDKSLLQPTPAELNDASKKKRKRSTSEHNESNNLTPNESQSKDNKKKKLKMSHVEPQESSKKSKKRKEREDDFVNQKTKIIKEDKSNKNNVPRLPESVLNKLADQPSKQFLEMKKSKITSTSKFIVEDRIVKRKNKPSNYLEESVYLNDDPTSPMVKKNTIVKKPKVLPFMPTVSTSDSGFTTKFQVDVLPQKIEFVAKAKSELPNIKNKLLQDSKLKKLRTYEVFKQNRRIKLSKY